MGVNRKLLYWGVFFLAIGAVMVAADLNGFDATVVDGLLRLWPLAIVALGVGLILRRTRVSLAGGMLAAAVPGLVIGGMFAAVPHVAAECTSVGNQQLTAQQGVFDGAANVSVSMRCGELAVDSAAGAGWQLSSTSFDRLRGSVSASGNSLSVQLGLRDGWFGVGNHAVPQLTLPAANPVDLSVDVGAGTGRLHLDGAQLSSLDVRVGAGEARVDLTGATVKTVTARTDAGSLVVWLPNTDFTGTFDANLGSLQICAPADLGVQIQGSARFGSAEYRGLYENGGVWQTPNYATAAHHAQLTANVSFGSIKLNPRGGCR